MDLPAEFFLETTQRVFQAHALAQGAFKIEDRRIDCSAVVDMGSLTIEGGLDPVCPAGHTQAAHALCSRVPPALRRHHVPPDADHYGTYAGPIWREPIHPLVRAMTARTGGPDVAGRHRCRWSGVVLRAWRVESPLRHIAA